jgi:large subunit ribosomal protein L29
MKPVQLREMTKDELLQKKIDMEEELFNLKLRKKTKQLDNPLRLRNLRRDVARIATILKEDELKIRSLAQAKEIKNSKDEGKKQ